MPSWQDGHTRVSQMKFSVGDKKANFKFLPISELDAKILAKVMDNSALKECAFLWRGEEIGKDSESITSEPTRDSCHILTGENIHRYLITGVDFFIRKSDVKKPLENYLSPKIVVRQLGSRINAAWDNRGSVTTQSVYNIVIDENKVNPKLILALLNSNCMHFVYRILFAEKMQFPRILLENLKVIPIPRNINKSVQQGRILQLVDQVLLAKKDAPSVETAELEKEIDQLVYKLYGLTEEEIRIVEDSTRGMEA